MTLGWSSRNLQVRSNLEAYESGSRERLEQTDDGRTALVHDGLVVGLFDDGDEACDAGRQRYGANNYSVVEIGARPVSLGRHSLVLD